MDEKKKQASGPVKWILIGISVIFLFVMLVLPLVVVVTQALSKGWECYVQAVTDEYTLKALALTIEATVAAVVCNTIFGLCAAWAMTRFYFRGKKLLTTLIDIPVTVSPVIAGLIYILVFGKQSPLYSVLDKCRDPDRVCSSWNYPGNDLCHISICVQRDHTGSGIHRVR